MNGNGQRTALRTCPLCEATCGLAIKLDGEQIVSIRGDDDDIFSKGFICPKAVALKELHSDPDRVDKPLIRQPDGTFAEVDPQQELDRKDEVAIRLQSNDSGYLYVLQRDAQDRWQPFASDRIQPSVPYTIPRTGSLRASGSGSREFFVTFSRLPRSPTTLALAVPAPPSGQQAGGYLGRETSVVTNVAEPAAQQVAFPITLKYK